MLDRFFRSPLISCKGDEDQSKDYSTMLFLIMPTPGPEPTSLAHQLNTSLINDFLPGSPPLWGLSFPQLEACALAWAQLGYSNWIITRKIQSPVYFWVPAKTSKDIGIWPDSHFHSRPFILLSFHFILLGVVNENQALGHYKSTLYIKTWRMVTGGLGN